MRIHIIGRISQRVLLLSSLACAAQLAVAQPGINGTPRGANRPAGQNTARPWAAFTPTATNILILTPNGTPLSNTPVILGFRSVASVGDIGSSVSSTTRDGHLTMVQPRSPLDNRDLGNFFPGPQEIYLSVPGVGTAHADNIEIKAAEAAPVTLRLQRGGTLKLSVREEESARAIGGASINISFLPDSDEVMQRDKSCRTQGMSLSEQRWTRDGDGIKEIDSLYPGRYLVSVAALGSEYSGWSQKIEIKEGQTLTLTADLQRASLTTSQLSVLQLSVKDQFGKSLNNTKVEFYLRPAGNMSLAGYKMSSERTLFTDAQGQGTLYPVKPGHWQISPLFTGPKSMHVQPQEIEIPAAGGKATIVVK